MQMHEILQFFSTSFLILKCCMIILLSVLQVIYLSKFQRKSCIIEKTLHFTHFDPKNNYISGYKIVHLCTSATVPVHIYMITVALVFNILHFFLSPSPHSLIFSFSLSPLSRFISGPSVHRSIQPHSHRSPISPASRSLISSVLPLMSKSQCHH